MRSIFLLLFFLQIATTFAQQIIVLDSSSLQPIEYVSIVGMETNTFLSTNAKGEADIASLKNDSTISINFINYKTKYFSFENLANSQQTILLSGLQMSDPIVISATRWKQSKKGVPRKISSINKQDYLFQNPQTSADLLESSGEVFIQKSQQGGGSPMIRGFSTNRLLYAVDGVRMNTAIFRSGNLQNVISLDPLSMEQVEVLFGPGSIQYGSDAIGGVMSFTSKSPALSKDSSWIAHGNAGLRLSSANSELSSHLDFSIGTKQWGFLTSYSRSDFGDLKMGTDGPADYKRDSLAVRRNNQDIVVANSDDLIQTPSNYEQQNFMQKVVFQAKENLVFNYAFHFSETSEYDRYDRLTQKRNGTLRYGENKYGPQKWMMNQLGISNNKSFKAWDKYKINFAVQNFEESRIDRLLNNTTRRNRVEKVDVYSINSDFTKRVNGVHQLFYGFENIYNRVNSSASSIDILSEEVNSIQSRYPNSDWFSNAIYLSDQFQLNEKLILEGGVRINQYSLKSEFDTSFISLPFDQISLNKVAFNGSFGAIYKAKDYLTLSSNLSTGFRSPNVDDMGKVFDSEPNSVVVPNSALKAEYAYNIDLGMVLVINDIVKLDFTLFYTFLDNALVRRDFQLNGADSLFFDGETRNVQAIQNAANANVYGCQAGLEVKLNHNLNWTSQLNYQVGEEELDDGSSSPSRHAAPLFGISRLTYSTQKWQLQFNVKYSDKVSHEDLNIGEQAKPHLYALNSEGKPFSPSWYTLNLKSQYSFNSHIVGTVGIENLTDQRYRTYSSGISSSGRNFVFSLRAKF